MVWNASTMIYIQQSHLFLFASSHSLKTSNPVFTNPLQKLSDLEEFINICLCKSYLDLLVAYPPDQSNETPVRLDLNLIITASSVLVFVHGCTRASPASLNHPRGCSGHPRSSRRTVPRHTCFQKPPEQHLSCLLSKLELAQELGQMLFSAGRPCWLGQASTRNANSGGFWG